MHKAMHKTGTGPDEGSPTLNIRIGDGEGLPRTESGAVDRLNKEDRRDEAQDDVLVGWYLTRHSYARPGPYRRRRRAGT